MTLKKLILSTLFLATMLSPSWAVPVPMHDNVGAASGLLSGAEGIDYTFQGTAGQKLCIALFTDNPGGTIVNVFSPNSRDGEADVFSNYVTSDLAGEATLPVTGTYTLRLGLRKPDRDNAVRVNYTFTIAMIGGQSSGSASAPQNASDANALHLSGYGTYMVSGNPVQPVESLDLTLNKDGSAKVGVNLQGDGFFVNGKWAQVGSHGVLLGLNEFAETRASGTGSISYGENHHPTKIFLSFEVPGQKTNHSLTFEVK